MAQRSLNLYLSPSCYVYACYLRARPPFTFGGCRHLSALFQAICDLRDYVGWAFCFLLLYFFVCNRNWFAKVLGRKSTFSARWSISMIIAIIGRIFTMSSPMANSMETVAQFLETFSCHEITRHSMATKIFRYPFHCIFDGIICIKLHEFQRNEPVAQMSRLRNTRLDWHYQASGVWHACQARI